MYIGILKIELFIAGSQSLKDKRRVVKSLIDSIRKRFNAAINEAAYQDQWQRSALGIVVIDSNKIHVQHSLDKIIDFFQAREGDFSLLESRVEIEQISFSSL